MPTPVREHTTAGSPFPDFAEAAQAVLTGLRSRLPLRLWMVTRAVGDDEIVLRSEDALDERVLTPGMVLSWSGSLCAQMVAGNGPTIAPDVNKVPAYASAANRNVLPVEAYVGVPLRFADGKVFGTLCGFDPEPQSAELLAAEAEITLAARLLATVLNLELGQEQQRRRAERAELDATRDELTGLSNRRGWNQILTVEEARCRRYGHAACVLVVDVNGLKAVNDTQGHSTGDELLRRCAQVMSSTTRDVDLVSRLGGDEFAILAVETEEAGGLAKAAQLRRALAEAGVLAAIGVAARSPQSTIEAAWKLADAAMYEDKP